MPSAFERFWIALWGRHLPTPSPSSAPADFSDHPDRLTTPKALSAELDYLEARLERRRLAILKEEAFTPPKDER